MNKTTSQAHVKVDNNRAKHENPSVFYSSQCERMERFIHALSRLSGSGSILRSLHPPKRRALFFCEKSAFQSPVSYLSYFGLTRTKVGVELTINSKFFFGLGTMHIHAYIRIHHIMHRMHVGLCVPYPMIPNNWFLVWTIFDFRVMLTCEPCFSIWKPTAPCARFSNVRMSYYAVLKWNWMQTAAREVGVSRAIRLVCRDIYDYDSNDGLYRRGPRKTTLR